jgi:prophage regulatory protein
MPHDVSVTSRVGLLPATRAIRRPELRRLVPLADTTIYEMEKRGEFPRRFALTRRCVVWDLGEIEAWLAERKQAANAPSAHPAEGPDVRDRRRRPVRR